MARLHFPLLRPFGSLLVGLVILFVTGSSPAEGIAAGAVADRDEIIHVLNRITFGPRPGDVEAVEKMGLRNYIQQQLHPETIDDSAVERQVAGFELLQKSRQELANLYLEEIKQKRQKKLEQQRLPGSQWSGPSQPDDGQ